MIADITDGDLYEIKALEEYTKELNHYENISKMWEKGLDN